MSKVKKNFYISAIYTSPPTTMGGNTKIMLEMIDTLADIFNFVIFTTEPKTFEKNLRSYKKITINRIQYPFHKFSYTSHIQEIQYITGVLESYFKKKALKKEDYFYSCSDFAPDVLPIYSLREKYTFTWIASLYLFIPNPIKNIKNKYGFPFVKYAVYYFYQRYIFKKIISSADLFFITNDYDKKYFPDILKNKIFAIYGGVNIDEVKAAKKKWSGIKKYDAVFCSRLHPQKGISQVLDIWAMVVRDSPHVQLAIIGNGEKQYELYLKRKATKLGINRNIKWLGYVNGIEKYKIYLQSNVFLHGTIYDNNGMVAAEALCTGLPVIMFDLPQLRNVYNKGCIKITVGNLEEYCNVVKKILKDNSIKINTQLNDTERKNIMEYWDWKRRILNVKMFLENSREKIVFAKI